MDLLPKDRQNPFQRLRFTLQVKADDQLQALREEKRKEEPRERLRRSIDPAAIEKSIAYAVHRDFTESAVAMDAQSHEHLSVEEMVQVIIDTGNWAEVIDPEEIIELRKQYPFALNLQHLLRSTSTETDAIQRYLQIYLHKPGDLKSSRVAVVLSNAERKNNIDAFLQRATLKIITEINEIIANSTYTLDMSPRTLIMRVLSLDDMNHNNDFDEEIIRRLFPYTARHLAVIAPPGKITDFLNSLAEAVMHNGSLDLPDRLNGLQYLDNATRRWSVWCPDEGTDVQITVITEPIDSEKLV